MTSLATYPNTVPFRHLQPLLHALERLGHPIREAWRASGAVLDVETALGGEQVEIPVLDYIRVNRYGLGLLEQAVCEREQRPATGKDAFDLMCACVVNCADIGEVIQQATLFNRILDRRGGELSLKIQGISATFAMDSRRRQRDQASFMVDLTGLSAYHQLFSWLTGRAIPLQQVGFMYAAPEQQPFFSNPFNCTIAFEQTTNYLVFPAHCLRSPVVRSYAELKRIIDYFPFDIRLTSQFERDLPDVVHLLILEALQRSGKPLGIDALAQIFYVSPQTLRRRLARNGTSYSHIKEICLQHMADHYLHHSDMTLERIADLLGFSDARAFRRAFQQWTGLSPSIYRRKPSRKTNGSVALTGVQ